MHKEEESLNSKDLQDFNTALLAKQLLRLIDKPYCLFSKVFKGRYFRHTHPLENTDLIHLLMDGEAFVRLNLWLKNG